jgi:hypothetical protein
MLVYAHSFAQLSNFIKITISKNLPDNESQMPEEFQMKKYMSESSEKGTLYARTLDIETYTPEFNDCFDGDDQLRCRLENYALGFWRRNF